MIPSPITCPRGMSERIKRTHVPRGASLTKTLSTKTFVIVPFSFYAKHRWLKAPKQVKFLREYHGHDFICEVKISVEGLDRELEFFILRDYINKKILPKFINSKSNNSCEHFAHEFLAEFIKKYGRKHTIIVKVTEDNIQGAEVYNQ